MLSNEETAAARRLIEQYRGFARQWRFLRWLVLAAGLLMLVIMVFAWQQFERLASFDAVVLPGDPEPAELKGMLIDRVDMLRLELKLYLTVFLHAMLGPIFVFAALYGWNRWPVQALLKAKLLESALANELAASRSFEFMKAEDA